MEPDRSERHEHPQTRKTEPNEIRSRKYGTCTVGRQQYKYGEPTIVVTILTGATYVPATCSGYFSTIRRRRHVYATVYATGPAFFYTEISYVPPISRPRPFSLPTNYRVLDNKRSSIEDASLTLRRTARYPVKHRGRDVRFSFRTTERRKTSDA